MTVEAAIRDELIGYRLSSNEVDVIMGRVKKKHPQFKDVWADRRRDHTKATLDGVWETVRQTALATVPPDHFAKSYLET